jgi:hypothetical protein
MALNLSKIHDRFFFARDDQNDILMDTKSEAEPGSPADAGGVTITDDGAIVRDDQFDFPALLDAVNASRRGGGRLKLVDSGKLSSAELEWLGEAGADIFTSDRARPSPHELVLVSRAANRSGGAAAYLHHGPFTSDEKERTIPFAALKEMGRSGIRLAVSNGGVKRESAALDELAVACASGGTRLVYYHHGSLEPELEGIARAGVWIHIAGSSLQNESDVAALCDLAKAARENHGNIVLHIEKAPSPVWLADIFDAGVQVLFQTPPSDYRSPLKPFELKAARHSPDPRSYYLHPGFML